MKISFFQVILLAVVVTLGACASLPKTAPEVVQGYTLYPMVLPVDTTSALYAGLRNAAALHRLYRDRNYEPLWLHARQFTSVVADVENSFSQARYYGLAADTFYTPELKTLDGSLDSAQILRKEVLLTDRLLLLLAKVSKGSEIVSAPVTDTTFFHVIQNVASGSAIRAEISAVEPRFTQYELLKNALAVILDGSDSSALSARNINTIAVNLDRWRRETKLFANRHLWVNVPSFSVKMIEGGNTIFESRAIVGSVEHQTQFFSSNVECLTVYPFWRVPRKIAVKEYLARIQADTTFLVRNNFDVIDRKGEIVKISSVNWSSLSERNFPYVLRQREGEDNALGLIKFNFDNPYAIFMHDTNAKSLFAKQVRTFSHGCIRVEDAYALSRLLFASEPGKIRLMDHYLAKKQRATIDLTDPIEIHIRYVTCEVIDGKVVYYQDVYHLDGAGNSADIPDGTH